MATIWKLWLIVAMLVIAAILFLGRDILSSAPFDRSKLVAMDPTPEWCKESEAFLNIDAKIIYFLNQGEFLYQHPGENWLYAAPQLRFDLGQFKLEPTTEGKVTLRSLLSNRKSWLIKVSPSLAFSRL